MVRQANALNIADAGFVIADGLGNFDTSTDLAQPAGTVPVMSTVNSYPNQALENRTWTTQYVVDPSSTVGLRGTFSTIQAAMDQAVSDGMLYTNQKVIYIRTGSYTENLVIRPGTILVGETLSRPTGGIITPTQNTVISGAHTFSGNAVCGFNNLVFTASSGDIFNGTGAGVVLAFFNNCLLAQTGSDQIVNAFPASSTLTFNDCSFVGTSQATNFTLSSTQLNLLQCNFVQDLNFAIDGGFLNAQNSYGLGVVILTSAAFINADNCTFVASGTNDYVIDSSASGNPGKIRNCFFDSAPTFACISQAFNAGAYIIQNCGINAAGGADLYTTTTAVQNLAQQGSILTLVSSALTYNASQNDYFIRITDTSATRTVNLPDTPQKGQIFIVKDASGSAATNNITVTTLGGSTTFDGSTSFAINTNYGSASFVFNGTNYDIF